MVGSAIVRCLQVQGCQNILTRTHAELDLTDQAAVRAFFRQQRIDHIILAAAKVGGIHANNTYPAEFIYSNLMIQNNVIHEAYQAGIQNLTFLGSSCVYPKHAPQPLKEEYLLTGPLEATNEPYAVAKIAGIKMCEAYNRQYGTQYFSVMPTNLYGPNDNYHLENSHVIPAMIRKFHLAKLAMAGDAAGIRRDEDVYGQIPEDIQQAICYSGDGTLVQGKAAPHVVLWGTGKVYREFLHVDDMAAACVFLMGRGAEAFAGSALPLLNIGAGEDNTILEVAHLISNLVGYKGDIVFNSSQPDGTPRKLLDCSRINALGWNPTYTLKKGLADTYHWYLKPL